MKRQIFSFLVLCLSISVYSQNARQYLKAGREFLKNGNYADAVVQFTE